MATTMASAGSPAKQSGTSARGGAIHDSILRLQRWLEENDYRGYDTFDGLNAKYVRPLTFNNGFLLTALQQGVRRFPLNLRPLLGVKKDYSTKGMGFLARGFLRMYRTTGDAAWSDKAKMALDWLIEHRAAGYNGACWGNHFDYQSRSFYLPKGVPTVVWTSLIGHAFVDGFEQMGEQRYFDIAVTACEHILADLERFPDGDAICIGYIPAHVTAPNKMVHNSSTLAASLLARVYARTRKEEYRSLAEKAIRYTAKYQRPDASWYYGEKANLHWVDNFHTAYVLDSFKHYQEATGDRQFEAQMDRGYDYWKKTFFLADGTPRYYDRKTLPIDIQCSSQAIDTLVFFRDRDPESISLATKVANWTIENMQDRSGYFYYRRYSRWLVNKTPTLHWGQATMMCSLAGLYEVLAQSERQV